ncbi:MAG TPA: hypothetical protein PLF15_00595 [bacterium]|nr:hypothetical protein [bacterium]
MGKVNNQKLADLIFILHIFWMLWAIISLPLVLLFDWYLVICLVFLIITISSWVLLDECLFNRWEHHFRQWDYDNKKTRGEFFVRVLKFFSINISGKTAAKINQGYIFCLLIITLLRIFKVY